jgi:hypothetical protein
VQEVSLEPVVQSSLEQSYRFVSASLQGGYPGKSERGNGGVAAPRKPVALSRELARIAAADREGG